MKPEHQELISELEADIAEKQIALDEAKAALAFLRKKYGATKNSNNDKGIVTPDDQLPITDSGFIDLSELVSPTSRPSLSDAVADLVSKFGDQEFNVGHIYAALEKLHAIPDVKSPKASIAQVLSNLESKGRVMRVFRGSGNTPHRFKYVGGLAKPSDIYTNEEAGNDEYDEPSFLN